MNVVESVMSQSMTPNFLLEYSDIPTTFIKKVGLGLLQRQSIRSASFGVMYPLSSNDVVSFAPIGNPHNAPITIG